MYRTEHSIMWYTEPIFCKIAKALSSESVKLYANWMLSIIHFLTSPFIQHIGIRQSICYLPGAHTFRVPAVFDYIGMLQSLPKLLCQFHFLFPVLFFYLWEVLYQSNTWVLFTSGTRHNKSLKNQMKKPRLDFHELCRTTSLLVPAVKDLKYIWQRWGIHLCHRWQ